MLNRYYESLRIIRRARYQNSKKEDPKKEEIIDSYNQENNLLNLVGETKNFLEILKLEKGELEANKDDLLKEFKLSTLELLDSIDKDLEVVDAALDNLKKMEGKASYIGLIYYSALSDFDSKGLPFDVVREALAGQRQSITNSLSGMNSKEDAIIYQLRRNNLLTAEKKYILIQHEYMRYFSQKYPDHYASRQYLSKN